MTEEVLVTLQSLWYWVMNQLGWEGIQLGWFPILLLVLAVVGALVILRNLLGSHSGGGGSGGVPYSPYAPLPNQRGFTTRFYTGSSKLGDFSVPPQVYNFKVPSPTPNLSKLREPLSLNLEKAREMYLMSNPRANRSEAIAETFQSIYGKKDSGLESKPVSSSMEGERSVAANGSGTSQPVTSSPPERNSAMRQTFGHPYGLDWGKAMELFVPKFGKEKKSGEEH